MLDFIRKSNTDWKLYSSTYDPNFLFTACFTAAVSFDIELDFLGCPAGVSVPLAWICCCSSSSSVRRRINSEKISAADMANWFWTTIFSSSSPLNAMRIRESEVTELNPLEWALIPAKSFATTSRVSQERSAANLLQIFITSGKQSEKRIPL